MAQDERVQLHKQSNQTRDRANTQQEGKGSLSLPEIYLALLTFSGAQTL